MKLQEAISICDNLQEKLSLLNTRLLANVRVPQGTKPTESPEKLFREIDADLREWKRLSSLILKSEAQTYYQDKSISQLLSDLKNLEWRINFMKEVTTVAADSHPHGDVAYVSTVDIPLLTKQINTLEELHRELSGNIQSLLMITEIDI